MESSLTLPVLRGSETHEQQEHEEHLLQQQLGVTTRTKTKPAANMGGESSSVTGQIRRFWKDFVQPEFNMIKSAVSIESIVKKDIQDPNKYPEVAHQAHVRQGSDICSEEKEYLMERKDCVRDAFARYMSLDPTAVHPDDVPIVSFGGSGGGYRAMIAVLGYSEAMKRSGLWDLLTYIAGVSGSCWAISAYYTFGEADMTKVINHCKTRLAPHHPLSPEAVRSLLSSPEGCYSTLGPLVQKNASGLENVAMDLYSVFTTGYLFMTDQSLTPGGPGKPHLAEVAGHHRKWYKWTDALEHLVGGKQPLPILTAIRHERPWKDWVSKNMPFEAADPNEQEHQQATNSWFQWFEMTPFEVGCDELEAWCPTWGFGRPFCQGKSTMQLPEQSLALLLGLCTSAPAGPLTSYLATIKRNLGTGFLGASITGLSSRLTDLWGAQKKEEFQQHHPLHACDEHNFLYRLTPTAADEAPPPGIENAPHLQLIDSGMDNNCPTQVLLNPSRKVDIIINMDASSDVLKDSFQERVDQIGSRRGLKFTKRNPDVKADANEYNLDRFQGMYGQIYDGRRIERPETVVDSYGHRVQNPPAAVCEQECKMVYMPLLPNPRAVQGFDPSTAKFSGSYNLVWTAEQVEMLVKVCVANWREGEQSVRTVLRECYESKKRGRLCKEAN